VVKDGVWFVIGLMALTYVASVVWYRWTKKGPMGGSRPVWRKYARVGSMTILLVFFAWLAASLIAWDLPRPGRFSYTGGMVLTPEFVALALGLAIYNASYIAEIVRSAFQSIPRGIVEAADSLGLRKTAILRLIMLPLALRMIMPPLTNVYLNIFKSTSLAAAIAYPDVMSVFVGTVNNLVGQPLEIMTVTLLSYAFVAFAISLLMHLYSKKQALQSGEK
jgi:general L-amino acid transport system permease protein